MSIISRVEVNLFCFLNLEGSFVYKRYILAFCSTLHWGCLHDKVLEFSVAGLRFSSARFAYKVLCLSRFSFSANDDYQAFFPFHISTFGSQLPRITSLTETLMSRLNSAELQ